MVDFAVFSSNSEKALKDGKQESVRMRRSLPQYFGGNRRGRCKEVAAGNYFKFICLLAFLQ